MYLRLTQKLLDVPPPPLFRAPENSTESFERFKIAMFDPMGSISHEQSH